MLATALLAAAFASLTVPTATPPLAPTSSTSSWAQASSATLGWDVVHREPARDTTVARIATDGRSLYVRFDAQQSEAIAADQHTDDVGQGNDDAVWIDLWPDGAHGYFYQFEVTPNGTHYQSSSENQSYAPQWQSRGVTTAGGYTVTMAIPLDVLRGVHHGVWLVQFGRYVHATGAQYVWSHDPAQNSPDDIARAGQLTMPALAAGAATRAKPRLAVYALALDLPKSYGGATSRTGADLSIPLSATSSFYATVHPDYSNVELDQQSISPSVYQRYYSEVRPFFTQATKFYDNFDCDVCPAVIQLYTPGIPTPRVGYAIEGKRGNFGFASFDSVGRARNDLASVLDYTSPDNRWRATVQRVRLTMPGFGDTTTAAGVSYYDQRHTSFYLNHGEDAGTNVSDRRLGQWFDAGAGWAGQTFGFFGSMRSIGAQYNPADGFVSHPGIGGYALYVAKIFDFSPKSKLVSAGIGALIDRYQGQTFGQAQSDNAVNLDILMRSVWDFQLSSGSDYWRFGSVLTPVSQNAGASLTYHSGLQTNNPGQFPNHGSSATPTSIQWSTGRYGDGRLDTWFRSTTFRAGLRGLFTLTLDDTAQRMRAGTSNVQWFDSASYTFQIGRTSSVAFGLRRVIGYPPLPNGGGNCMGRCTNLSFAYHVRLPQSELYFAYGDPNTLTTMPQLLFKMIFYAGAQKGT